MASWGSSVRVVWMGDRDGHPRCYTISKCSEVYYKRSEDGRKTWGRDVRLTVDSPLSGRPDVAVLAPDTLAGARRSGRCSSVDWQIAARQFLLSCGLSPLDSNAWRYKSTVSRAMRSQEKFCSA